MTKVGDVLTSYPETRKFVHESHLAQALITCESFCNLRLLIF